MNKLHTRSNLTDFWNWPVTFYVRPAHAGFLLKILLTLGCEENHKKPSSFRSRILCRFLGCLFQVEIRNRKLSKSVKAQKPS